MMSTEASGTTARERRERGVQDAHEGGGGAGG